MRPAAEVKRILIKRWLDKADSDLQVARALFSEKQTFYEITCFHSQQAVEKCLKAYLTDQQIEFPKTHDIEELLELVATADPKLADSLRPAAPLTVYAIDSRYPGNFPESKREDARRVIELAEKAREALTRKIKGRFPRVIQKNRK